MGLSSSKEQGLPPWAPPSLRTKDVPEKYLELRHPNGSVAHVVGVKHLSSKSVNETQRIVGAAKPDSVLLELCDERVAPVWELLEKGKRLDDGSIVRLLPELAQESFKSDSRLRRTGWWLCGLGMEGYASLAGTTLWAPQAVAAAEAAKLRAQTHLIDRPLSVSLQRSVIANLENFKLGAPPVLPQGLTRAWNKLKVTENPMDLREEARAAIEDGDPIVLCEPLVRYYGLQSVEDERDVILAHRCWECLTTLGAGGVAVAVVDVARLNGIRQHWSKTEADDVKAKLDYRDAPSVLTATAPFLAGAAATTYAASYLPTLYRRLAVTSLISAPCAATLVAFTQCGEQYKKIRELQLKLDHKSAK